MCLKKTNKKENLELPFWDKVGKKKKKREREVVSIFIYSLNVYEFSRVSCHLDLTLGSLGLIMTFFCFVFLLHIKRRDQLCYIYKYIYFATTHY